MRRLEHALIGTGAGAALAHVTGGNQYLLMLASAAAATLPDADLHWSSRRYPPPAGAPCRLLEHRGPTHSLTAAALAGVTTALLLSPVLGLAIALGWLSHLVADGLSYMGVPFLWPLVKRRYRLVPWRALRVRSGSRLVELPIACAVLISGLSLSL